MSHGHKIQFSIDRGTEETPDFQVLGDIVGGTVFKKSARLVDGKRWSATAPENDVFEVENVSEGEATITIRYSNNTANNTLSKSIEVGNTETIKVELPAPYSKTITRDVIVQDRDFGSESGKLIDVTYTLMPTGDGTEVDA